MAFFVAFAVILAALFALKAAVTFLYGRYRYWAVQRACRAGHRRDLPIVVRRGRLIELPDGRREFHGWLYDTDRLERLTWDHLWSHLSDRCRVEHPDRLKAAALRRLTVWAVAVSLRYPQRVKALSERLGK